MSVLGDEQFDYIERECGIRVDAERRRDINQTIEYWSQALMPERTLRSRRAPGRKDRESKRKRRLQFVMELALHYEVAGGRPEQQKNWDRPPASEMPIAMSGFPLFLKTIYLALPEHARPVNEATFIRDAELLGFNRDPTKDRRGGSLARAAYLLRTMTAWRRPPSD